MIAGQTGLAGSVVLEDGVVLAGQVGLGDHSRIGAGARMGARSGTGSAICLEGGQDYGGAPAKPVREWAREIHARDAPGPAAQAGRTMTESATLDVEQIKKLLPHRAPMLLVERLTDIVPLESATGYKAVSINEPFFMGHFPDRAVMPGVLIVEAMAQTAGALVVHSLDRQRDRPSVYFMTIEKARFRKPVRAGRSAAHAGQGAAPARPGVEIRRPGLCRRRSLRRSRIQRHDP